MLILYVAYTCFLDHKYTNIFVTEALHHQRLERVIIEESGYPLPDRECASSEGPLSLTTNQLCRLLLLRFLISSGA